MHNDVQISCEILDLNFTFIQAYKLWDLDFREKTYTVKNHIDNEIFFINHKFVNDDAKTFNPKKHGFQWCENQPSFINGIFYSYFYDEFRAAQSYYRSVLCL